ncbi:MAG: hypothetical protein KDK76_03035 [Chlamydiia bacterium]|nr:hypothetical protein [Chlamydiia bacterium]
MKKFALTLITLSTSLFAQEKELSLSELSEIGSTLSDITSLVIKINPGDTLPINFHLSGDVFEIENGGESKMVRAKEPLYIKLEPQFLFSTDKKEWKPFESYFTGTASVSIGKDGTSEGGISLDLNKRR